MSIDTYPPQSTQATVQVTDTLSPLSWDSSLNVLANATWADAIATYNFFWWRVPTSYAGGDVTFTIYRRAGSPPTGTAVMLYGCQRFRIGSAQVSIEGPSNIDFAPGNNLTTALTKTVAATNIVVGDSFRFEVWRDGVNAGDTLAAGVGMDSASITYNAYVMGYAAYPASVNNASYEEGTFTVTATGFTTAVTGTARYVRVGKQVTLMFPASLGTSNATTLTVTGLLPALAPVQQFYSACWVEDNGVWQSNAGMCTIAAGGVTFDIYKTWNFGAFVASGEKAMGRTAIAYLTA